jgi:hypothetical protein
MKKILVLSIVLLGVFLISCSSLSIPPESSIEPTPFEGVWMREDGATYTFTGNYVEYLDMTNGVAAHGFYRYNTSEDERDRQIIIYLPENPLQLAYLKLSHWSYERNYTPSNRSINKPTEFIHNAFREYKTKYRTEITVEDYEFIGMSKENNPNLERQIKLLNEKPFAEAKDEYSSYSHYGFRTGAGGLVVYYIIDGDTLIIKTRIPHISSNWYSFLDGQFIKQ